MSITDRTAAGISTRQVAGNIGAELSNVTLGGHLDPEVVHDIRSLAVRHKVVFFRGQGHLDDEAHAAFASLLGPLTTAHPTVPSLDTNPHVFGISSLNGGRANNWHTDVTFVDRPPSFSVLRAVQLPPVGGDTVWANTAAAYASLPEDLRELADRLWAVHTNDFDYARLGLNKTGDLDPATAAYADVFASVSYETLHPVVRIHPESGERALLLGGFARQIAGLSGPDSAALIRVFQDHITRLENTVRWQWEEGDVIIWDNRATQHYAVADYGLERRMVHRITVVGEVPVGIDGTSSQSIKGDASDYNATLAA